MSVSANKMKEFNASRKLAMAVSTVVLSKKLIGKFKSKHTLNVDASPVAPVDITSLSEIRGMYSEFDHGDPIAPDHDHDQDHREQPGGNGGVLSPFAAAAAAASASSSASASVDPQLSSSVEVCVSASASSSSTSTSAAMSVDAEPVSLDSISVDVQN